MKIKFEGELKDGISSKTGNSYTCVDLEFPNGYVKRIFLNDAEKYIIRSILDKQAQSQPKA